MTPTTTVMRDSDLMKTYLVLNQTVHNGDTIELVNESGTQIGLDFVELETASEPIKQPANSVSITDFGARPNDGQDDSDALFAAVYHAKQTGKSVYIPEGEFTFNRKIWLEAKRFKNYGCWNVAHQIILLQGMPKVVVVLSLDIIRTVLS